MSRSIVLMWGLPGSGKTHFVRETYLKNNGRKVYTSVNPYGSTVILALDYKVRAVNGKVNLVPVEDTVYSMTMTPERRLREFESSLNSVEKLFTSGKVSTVVVDTPCCSYEYFRTIVGKISEMLLYADVIDVEAFEENREICKVNDYGRRNIDSRFSIDSMPFDFPTADSLSEIVRSAIGDRNVRVVVNKHSVFQKDTWKNIMQKYLRDAGEEFIPDSILKSESYSLGGTIYGIGGEVTHQVEGEPMGEFTELDDLLVDLCPELTFVLYRQIKSGLVKIVEQDDSDYYSRCSSVHYEIDLAQLYEFLERNNVKMRHFTQD